MLAGNKDVVSSFASMVEHEPVEEDDDGWVLVKKQRITILVPPPPPVQPQTKSPEASSICTNPGKTAIRKSNATKKRHHKNSNSRHKKSAVNHPKNRNLSDAEHKKHAVISSGNEIEIYHAGFKAQESHHNALAPFDDRADDLPVPVRMHPDCSDHLDDRNIAPHSRIRTFEFSEGPGAAPRMLVGALSVVNLRMRALNLERKLERIGGLRQWLVSKGLGHFVGVLEREKLGKYELVSLTMDKLKDMGTDAVGPRRKLIHAIDNLCQPYYCKAYDASMGFRMTLSELD